jgi:hypothetical protein
MGSRYLRALSIRHSVIIPGASAGQRRETQHQEDGPAMSDPFVTSVAFDLSTLSCD